MRNSCKATAADAPQSTFQEATCAQVACFALLALPITVRPALHFQQVVCIGQMNFSSTYMDLSREEAALSASTLDTAVHCKAVQLVTAGEYDKCKLCLVLRSLLRRHRAYLKRTPFARGAASMLTIPFQQHVTGMGSPASNLAAE